MVLYQRDVMKIVVTGCAGFIGFHLTRRLLADGHEVVGIDNLNDYYAPELKLARLRELGLDADDVVPGQRLCRPDGQLTFVQLDIEDKELLDLHLNSARPEVLCHLAAQAGVRYSITHPQQYISSNIQGFFNVLEYCRYNSVRKFVFASSSSVYGNNTSVPYREDAQTDTPVSLYAATKKSNELLAYSYASLYGISTVGLRFFTVYGPWGRPDMAPFLFADAIFSGRPIQVFNRGDMSRDFTYIDDIIEGVCKVLTEGPILETEAVPDFHIYNIGNSKPVQLGEFINTMERLAGKEAIKEYLPMQAGDVKTTWADTTLLQKHYRYTPATPLETGLRAFVEWFRVYYGL